MQPILKAPSALLLVLVVLSLSLSASVSATNYFSFDLLLLLLVAFTSFLNCRKHSYVLLLVFEYVMYVFLMGASIYANKYFDISSVFGDALAAAEAGAEIGKRSTYAFSHPTVAFIELLKHATAIWCCVVLGGVYLVRIVQSIRIAPDEQ